MTDPQDPAARARAAAGRRAALLLAGTGLGWLALNVIGGILSWPPRILGLVDLFALAGFGLALWMTYQVWRAGRAERDRRAGRG